VQLGIDEMLGQVCETPAELFDLDHPPQDPDEAGYSRL
jgi:hypothetical protein